MNRFSKNRHRRDNNHHAIAKRLEELGCSVRDLSQVGDNGPDLEVGILGRDYPVEIKDYGKTLSYEQEQWRDNWRGERMTVLWTTDQCDAWVATIRRRIIDAFR